MQILIMLNFFNVLFITINLVSLMFFIKAFIIGLISFNFNHQFLIIIQYLCFIYLIDQLYSFSFN